MSPKAARAANARPERVQRRHPRYRCGFPVIVTLFVGDKYQELEAQCKDLSPAGVGVLLGAELAIGEVVSLSFSLSGSDPEKPVGSVHPWEVRAILRHRRGYHYGFEFLSLAKEQGETIGKFVKGLERAD